MRKAMLYIHEKGGGAEEAAQFRPFCARYDVCVAGLPDGAGVFHLARA